MKRFIVILAIASLVLPFNAQAHPGRTDASGGHTCYTKCEKWGLKYGEYHKHTPKTKTAKTKAKTKSK